MDIQIGEIISQFVVAAIIFYFARQNEIYLKEEINRLRDERDELQAKYLADLRDWSGIDPRFKTWSYGSMEDDTQMRRRKGDTKRIPELAQNERERFLQTISDEE